MNSQEKQVKKAVEQLSDSIKQTTSTDYEKIKQKAKANADQDFL